ncbi:hypothetical protein B0H17DRAFT_1327116 [Mycena rosella]|uniref:Polyketide synthase n=1 Tax=Mycena rosella TaxID=1033263 RepID=A0AAD7DZS7_MYCRO|nr:hypothetical protein B0H17DRAFT_1327116 [Mycena rosella]
MSLNVPSSLLEVFIDIAANPSTADRRAIECGSDAWTYAELDTISSAMADELKEALGSLLKVACVSENHPYLFALMLAVWKLGGIFIPIDAHVPSALLRGMIRRVEPSCIVLLTSDTANTSCAAALNLCILTFDPKTSTIPALNLKYGKLSRVAHQRPLPHPDQSCLYLFTSSATSSENLKPVPLTHKLIVSNCCAKLAWWRRMQPSRNMDGIRVLGWAPWSHVLSHMQDIGTATLLNAGCYVFASVPASYATAPESEGPIDLMSRLIAAILHKNVSAFSCVPFVLSGLKAACESGLPGNTALLRALRSMIMLECGGAMLDRELCKWAAHNEVPRFVGVGMTETGGAIFAGRAGDAFSGFSPEGLISDAQFFLLGNAPEGELVIKSKLIPQGYINYDDGSFAVDRDGWVTFRTGDRYSRTADNKFEWLGRTTDFIQMTSSETLDPRPIERALCASKFIHQACVIGNMFLKGPSTAVCAIIELKKAPDKGTAQLDGRAPRLEVARVLAPINGGLLPAVRIAPSSVLILEDTQTIPLTRKREIFRKKIEGMFGTTMEAMHAADLHPDESLGQVENAITHIVSRALGVTDPDMLNSMSFAELGLTSLLAVSIASVLNSALEGRIMLPLNICYIHLNLPSLIEAVVELLGPKYNAPGGLADSDQTVELKDDIVIVGKAFRLPGGVDNHAALRDALLGKNGSIIAEIPPDRWDHASFFPRDISFRRAGLVDAASYDHSFFGLTATEAFYVSPTMRLALEVAFEALENANIPVSKVKGSKMAVYVATKDDGFETLLHAAHGYGGTFERVFLCASWLTVSIHSILRDGACTKYRKRTNQLVDLLDVHGPSLTIDTACSGGIVCMDQAATYLQSGAGESAIVCSSNTHCWPGSFMFLTAQGMTSPNSRCATFTSDADGYVPSEGSVAFILKTRRAAIRDKDHILATIKGTEVTHNGRSQGLAAPNMKSQAALHRALLRKARLDPSLVDFIETHGTGMQSSPPFVTWLLCFPGTSLGDLCEVQGINEAFSSRTSRTDPLILGASKTALGHTECSAGLVGILSVLLSFKEGFVPGLHHLREDNLNPLLDCTSVPLLIPAKPEPIPTDKPCTALVMSYGFSGTLAEIALESPQPSLVLMESDCTGPMIFAISAKSPAALEAYIDLYLLFLRDADARAFHKVCYTTCIGREHYKYRFACAATDLPDLIKQVELRVSRSSPPIRSTGSLAFAFSGQGTQFPGMAAALAEKYSRFRHFIVESGHQARALCGVPVDTILLSGSGEIEGSETAQICIFIFQYSICRWMKELGIKPRAVIGHSLGEITAAVIAGGLTFEIGLDLVITRARLLRPSPDRPAGMVALASTEAKVSEVLALEEQFAHHINISVINSPQSVTVSGMLHDLETLLATAKHYNIKATRVQVDQGFHSPCVDGALPGLRHWSMANSMLFTPLQMPLYSSFLGTSIKRQETLHSEHWVNHARQPVQFSRAATAIQEDKSIGAILDIGPQTIAWSLLLSNGRSASATIALSAKKGYDQEIALLAALAALFQNHRVTLDFSALYSQRGSFETTEIPTYPFQRVHRYPSHVPSRQMAASDTPVPSDEKPAAAQQEAALVKDCTRMNSLQLREALTMCVREVLEIAPGEELDDSEPLGLRGVDSIMFAQLRKRIEELYGLNLSVVFWSDMFSIANMIDNLVEQFTYMTGVEL